MTLSMLFGLLTGMIICKTSTTVNAMTKTDNIQTTSNIQGISYDYVYVGGIRYIVFMSPTGDIEVIR